MKPRTPIFGLLAEFEKPEQVLEATRQARREGYHEMDAFTPYPVEGLATELGMRRTRMPFLVLLTAVVGTAVGYSMQYWTMKVDYPFDVGGRPENSWPAFLPIVFEVMVLVASISALLGMLFLNGLPQPYHPLFRVERFVEANSFRFFLCIEAADPRFDREATARFLAGLAAARVIEVPN
jgi:hypothetical protein